MLMHLPDKSLSMLFYLTFPFMMYSLVKCMQINFLTKLTVIDLTRLLITLIPDIFLPYVFNNLSYCFIHSDFCHLCYLLNIRRNYFISCADCNYLLVVPWNVMLRRILKQLMGDCPEILHEANEANYLTHWLKGEKSKMGGKQRKV